MKRLQNRLKICGLALAILGLVAGYLDMKGFFLHPERKDLLETIRDKGEVRSDHPAFLDILDAFPPPKGWTRTEVKSLKPPITLTAAGLSTAIAPLRYTADGKKSDSIATFEELEEWAKESSYPWVSWWITLVGVLICGLGVGLEVLLPERQS